MKLELDSPGCGEQAVREQTKRNMRAFGTAWPVCAGDASVLEEGQARGQALSWSVLVSAQFTLSSVEERKRERERGKNAHKLQTQ